MKKLLRIKRLLKVRNSSGFTLVEVIISCALLSILILGIMMFVTPVLKMVTSGQKNARATMLSETVDTYISGVLRTAKMVEIFENVDCTFPETTSLNLMSSSPDGAGLHMIDEFMRTGDNALNYEVRAIGIVIKDSDVIAKQGIRIYNIPVENDYHLATSTLAAKLSEARPAFHDLMFEGLYPTVKIEAFKSQDSDTGDETTTNARGYRISTKVYSDSKCYSQASDEAREKSMLAFEGITYFEAMNLDKPASDIIQVKPTIQDAMDAHGEAENLYYPATIIYYVAPRK